MAFNISSWSLIFNFFHAGDPTILAHVFTHQKSNQNGQKRVICTKLCNKSPCKKAMNNPFSNAEHPRPQCDPIPKSCMTGPRDLPPPVPIYKHAIQKFKMLSEELKMMKSAMMGVTTPHVNFCLLIPGRSSCTNRPQAKRTQIGRGHCICNL